ncbi:yhhN-like family protein [Rhodococcus sp. MTM3W5.2]|uniref:lysoplasmalogenase n=1 Tax=Rhodococcus sp. MTM3W5.2 TaxID=1805827 RepID=UPI0009790CA8|nr:lysoplasmalogenase [Rhodococcus sp. MTM3W5.2]AQA24677.1 yhhN-like family protein [Rhodococcus sp. MTM3W5.2]
MIRAAAATLSRPALAALGGFAAVSAVHLIAQLAGADGIANVSQWFLMPLLALVLLLAAPAPRQRSVTLTLIALGFSWLGDTAPDLTGGDAAFLVMIGFFLLAQLAYIAAFWPYRGAVRRSAVLGYAVAVAGLFAACASGAGALLVPALIYGVCLGAMAALSTGVGAVAAVGGALFLVSDSMIALGAFADWFDPPASGLLIMSTYIAGQLLLTAGVLAAARATASTPVVTSSAGR